MYLRMKESYVFVHGLPKPIRAWQGIVPSDEVEYRLCSEISKQGRKLEPDSERPRLLADSRVQDLDHEWVEKDIIIEVIGVFQWWSLQDVC
jgi:hypothetical protein